MLGYFSLLFFLISWNLVAAHAPDQEEGIRRKISYERRETEISYFVTLCDNKECVRRVKQAPLHGSPKVRFEAWRAVQRGNGLGPSMSPGAKRQKPRGFGPSTSPERTRQELKKKFKAFELKYNLENFDNDQ